MAFNKGLANLFTKKDIIAVKFLCEGIQVDYGIVELVGKYYYLILFHDTYHTKLSKDKEKSLGMLLKKGYEINSFSNQVDLSGWLASEMLK